MTLGERITLARKKAGLSQEQLGDRLGVSRQAVSKWESSQANPDVAYVAELCRICGVSCDWLLLGEEGAREAPPARCGSCGAIVTGLDRYCPQCGHPLQKEEADTYSLVLVDPRKNLTAAFDALAWLSRRPWCAPEFPICRRSQEELEALLFRAPVSLMWGLSAQRASEALAAFRAPGWRRSTGTATAARRRSWCRSPRCRPSPSPARSPAGLPCPSGLRWGRCFWGCWPPCWCSPCFEAGREKTTKFLANGAGPLYTVLK